MTTDLKNWTPRPRPQGVTLEGRYCRLEPLEQARHGADLFAAAMAPGAEQRLKYLSDTPMDRSAFDEWLPRLLSNHDYLFFAVIDRASGRCEGRQALMRAEPAHGVIELGNIVWGPAIARTRVTTEAFYLHARHVFDDLGYRRFEWKCNMLNAPSVNAARRFGFTYEGRFRQHMVVKGESRDSEWFSIIDGEWPRLRESFERWLAPENFDADGRQKRKLAEFR